MAKLLAAFGRLQGGAAAVEYVVLVAGICLVILGAVYLLGEETNSYFAHLGNALDEAASQ